MDTEPNAAAEAVQALERRAAALGVKTSKLQALAGVNRDTWTRYRHGRTPMLADAVGRIQKFLDGVYAAELAAGKPRARKGVAA